MAFPKEKYYRNSPPLSYAKTNTKLDMRRNSFPDCDDYQIMCYTRVCTRGSAANHNRTVFEMADENTPEQEEQVKPGTPEAEKQEGEKGEGKGPTLEELQAENARMRAKMDEFLGETKAAKQKARELEEQKAKEERERLEKEQEFKTLWEREQEEKQKLQEQFGEFQKRVKAGEIEKAANGLANELSRDTKRAALLAEKAAMFAEYTDDGKVVYKMNGVEIEKEKLSQHLREEYPFLVDGNGSNGGGALGGGKLGEQPHGKNPDADAAAKKGDLGGYLAASLSQSLKR